MPRLFGTDGVRGQANSDITPDLSLKLGRAAARVLAHAAHEEDRRPRAAIARDTRISGHMLAQAMAAGLAGAGVDVEHADVLPTPGCAYLTASGFADLGVVISASHNPMEDNGIKFFAKGGFKLADSLEDEVEAILDEPFDAPIGEGVGHIGQATSGVQAYSAHLLSSIHTSLAGLHVVLDCANGATSVVAPHVFREAGARVTVINADPDGYNINRDCGSTHPEQLQAKVLEVGADMGLAFDGDADRCLAVDSQGKLVDGDQIMAILALALKKEGKLAKNTLVVTVMSNLGLILAMRKAGVNIVQTAVGDRYVLEAMREGGYSLGGEQSGHVIALDHATTGDGTLTALLLAQEVVRSAQPLSELAKVVTRLPQTLINVGNVDKAAAKDNESIAAAVAQAEAELGETGRVLLRPSGTEPLVRVMVEAATQAQCDEVAERLAKVVKENVSLG